MTMSMVLSAEVESYNKASFQTESNTSQKITYLYSLERSLPSF
jgi:hypothetical protein